MLWQPLMRMVIDKTCKMTVKGVKSKSESFFSISHGVLELWRKNLKGADRPPPSGLDRVNRGAERQVQLQNSLGKPSSGSSVRTFLKRDKHRVKKSQKAADTKEKSSDETLQVAREEALREKEGTTYEAELSKY